MRSYLFPTDMPFAACLKKFKVSYFHVRNQGIHQADIPIGMDTNWYGMPFSTFVKKVCVEKLDANFRSLYFIQASKEVSIRDNLELDETLFWMASIK